MEYRHPHQGGKKLKLTYRYRGPSIAKEVKAFGRQFDEALMPLTGPLPIDGLIDFLIKRKLAGFHRAKALFILGQCDLAPDDATREEQAASLNRRSIWLREANTMLHKCLPFYGAVEDGPVFDRVIEMIEDAWKDLEGEHEAFEAGKVWDPGYPVYGGEPPQSINDGSGGANVARQPEGGEVKSVPDSGASAMMGSATEQDSGTDADVTDPSDVSTED